MKYEVLVKAYTDESESREYVTDRVGCESYEEALKVRREMFGEDGIWTGCDVWAEIKKVEDNEVKENKPVYKYTVFYKGYIFDGDDETGWNEHDFDDWDEVRSIINAYDSDEIYVRFHEWGATFKRGEWDF